MSITRLKKMSLFGTTDQQEQLLTDLQALGCTHLIPLTSQELQASQAKAVQSSNEATEALAWLSSVKNMRRPSRDRSRVDVTVLVAKVLANKKAIADMREVGDELEQRIAELRPWGEFSLPPVEERGGQNYWFYLMPHRLGHQVQALTKAGIPWQEVHRDPQYRFVVAVSPEEPDEQLMSVDRSDIGDVPLSELRRQREKHFQDLEDLQAQREALTRWIYVLSQSLAASEDKAELALASAASADHGEFFMMQGWVPASREKALFELAERHQALVVLEEPDAQSTPPTLIDSDELTGGGSEAMCFFQTPHYREWDPGQLVFLSFSLFFAMIMSDAVYCLGFGLVLYLFRGSLQSSGTGRRLYNLGKFMTLLGVIWGVLVGGYLGFSPPENTLLGALNVLELNNYDAMMKLSVFIGVSHLAAANIMTARVNWPNPMALAPLGWALLMIGGLLLWFGLSETINKGFGSFLGTLLMLGGAGLVGVFSSDRPVATTKDRLLRVLDGVKAVYNITGAFGDVLSYMRLFALGLSGASLAMTFNSLASQAVDARPVLGVLFGGLILLLGHVLNFGLCIMSAVVHGMRLNVIEFVNWGLKEEGYPFKAFYKREE